MTTPRTCFKVCSGRACSANFSRFTLERAQSEAIIQKKNIDIGSCPCQGRCEMGPTAVIEKDEKKEVFSHVDPPRAAELIRNM